MSGVFRSLPTRTGVVLSSSLIWFQFQLHFKVSISISQTVLLEFKKLSLFIKRSSFLVQSTSKLMLKLKQIVLFLIGRPLYFMELSMGQFASKSSVRVWDMVPGFRGKQLLFRSVFLNLF